MDALNIYHTFCERDGVDLDAAVAAGMVPKDQLVNGKVYTGYCRNATRATWSKEQDAFIYRRTKFGAEFVETVPHPADDDGFDVFVPVYG